MVHSENCTKLVASFEGFSPEAYQDQRGIWTLGFGTVYCPDGSKVKEGDSCTETEAEAWLDHSLLKADEAIRKFALVYLTQNQWDALVSLIYNIGAGAFSKSTVLTELIRSEYTKAADAFRMWNKVKGEVNAGLSRRREAERALFLKP